MKEMEGKQEKPSGLSKLNSGYWNESITVKLIKMKLTKFSGKNTEFLTLLSNFEKSYEWKQKFRFSRQVQLLTN